MAMNEFNYNKAITFTLGSKLKKKLQFMKEKFEIDISEQQNQLELAKLAQKEQFQTFEQCLNKGL